jgi:peptide/nickel transport system substrate-binding protein
MASPDIDSHISDADWVERLSLERRIPYLARFENLLRRFSPAERLLFYCLSIILAASALMLTIGVARSFSVIVPAQGGTLTEGEVGPVRFINPLLALSQADEDLSALVYSGLMRANPEGTYSPDLAASYTISPDGTVYTFKLRPDATFQNGAPLTSADVAFTVALAQNPDIKSPQAANWEGVQVSVPDAHTVVFTLPHAYAPFMEDTTLGILPKALWQNVSPEEFPFSPLNTHPVGSGTYKISNFQTDSTGSATRYDLSPFSKFSLGAPFLSRITFLFYPNQNALDNAFNTGQINAIAGVSPSDLPSLTRKNAVLLQVPLPRTFGIFFNQSHAAVLQDSAVRAALNAAIDKQSLVDGILGGYGVPLSGPIPPGILGDAPQTTSSKLPVALAASSTPIAAANIAQAQSILKNGGWKFASSTDTWTKGKLTLSFTLSTADEPELVATADAAAAAWRAAGAEVKVQVYPLSEFNDTVLRPRNYDAILFGYSIGRTADLYAFWDSSQRNDPGLNLAMYANASADSLLTQARAQQDDEKRDKLYEQFALDAEKDQPAVFLYAPDFLYAVSGDISGIQLGALTDASDRFLNVYQWYADEARVWEIFTNQSN